ncbi:MAG: phosphatidate cytidylyltransferase [Gammaproteobacteria bacterium]
MLKTRIITALVLGATVIAVVVFLPTWGVATLLGVVWLIGAWEWAGFIRFDGLARLVYLVPFLAVMLTAPLWAMDREVINWILGVTGIWWLVALVGVLLYPIAIAMPVAAVSGLLVLLPAWLVFIYLHSTTGWGLTLGVLIIVWAADVGGYTFGRVVGSIKLASAVSPSKTWEGFVGGLILAAIVGWGLSVILALPPRVFVAIAVVTAIVSVIGDLTVSVFKRNVGLKGSSSLLPGHGGMLDRLDSLSAAVPVFVLGLNLTGIGE